MFTRRTDSSPSFDKRLQQARERIGVPENACAVKEWWEELERLNAGQPQLILRLAWELERRKVSISDFFDVWKHSFLEDVDANLGLLDQLFQDRDLHKSKQH